MTGIGLVAAIGVAIIGGSIIGLLIGCCCCAASKDPA